MNRTLTILIVAMFAATLAPAQTAGTAEGRLTVNGKVHELKYARAATLPDEMNKGKELLRIMISDVPFPSEAMFHEVELMELGADGKMNGVQLDIHEDGLVWMLRCSDSRASFSTSQSPNPFPAKIRAGKAEGIMTATEKAESNVDVAIEVSLKYSAPVEKYVPEPEPTAADAVAAKNSSAAQAYLKFNDALQKGDRAFLAMLDPEKRAHIDNEHFAEILAMIQDMEPKEIHVRKAVEKGGSATLWVTGKSHGEEHKGKIAMSLEGKQWIVKNEEW